jgi:Pentapeptide repeats (8 copies)
MRVGLTGKGHFGTVDANFDGANLTDANLSVVELAQASFRGSILVRTAASSPHRCGARPVRHAGGTVRTGVPLLLQGRLPPTTTAPLQGRASPTISLPLTTRNAPLPSVALRCRRVSASCCLILLHRAMIVTMLALLETSMS